MPAPPFPPDEPPRPPQGGEDGWGVPPSSWRLPGQEEGAWTGEDQVPSAWTLPQQGAAGAWEGVLDDATREAAGEPAPPPPVDEGWRLPDVSAAWRSADPLNFDEVLPPPRPTPPPPSPPPPPPAFDAVAAFEEGVDADAAAFFDEFLQDLQARPTSPEPTPPPAAPVVAETPAHAGVRDDVSYGDDGPEDFVEGEDDDTYYGDDGPVEVDEAEEDEADDDHEAYATVEDEADIAEAWESATGSPPFGAPWRGPSGHQQPHHLDFSRDEELDDDWFGARRVPPRRSAGHGYMYDDDLPPPPRRPHTIDTAAEPVGSSARPRPGASTPPRRPASHAQPGGGVQHAVDSPVGLDPPSGQRLLVSSLAAATVATLVFGAYSVANGTLVVPSLPRFEVAALLESLPFFGESSKMIAAHKMNCAAVEQALRSYVAERQKLPPSPNAIELHLFKLDLDPRNPYDPTEPLVIVFNEAPKRPGTVAVSFGRSSYTIRVAGRAGRPMTERNKEYALRGDLATLAPMLATAYTTTPDGRDGAITPWPAGVPWVAPLLVPQARLGKPPRPAAQAAASGTLAALAPTPAPTPSYDLKRVANNDVTLRNREVDKWRLRGISLVYERRTAEAVECFRQALALKPGDPAVLAWLQRVQVVSGQQDGLGARDDELDAALRARERLIRQKMREMGSWDSGAVPRPPVLPAPRL
ncbi:MAG: hypothetical protein VKQ33_13985 [Candidatus Sericytochromatia bacterium]|nr:hypothetical protein [Candidatus Sericytochromatia bacterium]